MALDLPARWTSVALPGTDVGLLPRIEGRAVRPTLMVYRWGDGLVSSANLDLRDDLRRPTGHRAFGSPAAPQGTWTVGVDHWRDGSWSGLRFLRIASIHGDSAVAEIRWLLWPSWSETGSRRPDVWTADPSVCATAVIGLEDLPLMDSILDSLVGRIPGDWSPSVGRGDPEEEVLVQSAAQADEAADAVTVTAPTQVTPSGLAPGWETVPLAPVPTALLNLLHSHPAGSSWGRLQSETTQLAVDSGLVDPDGLHWRAWASSVAGTLQEPDGTSRLIGFGESGREVRLQLYRRRDVSVVIAPGPTSAHWLGMIPATRGSEMMFRAMGIVPSFSTKLAVERVSLEDLIRRSADPRQPLPATVATDPQWKRLWETEQFSLWMVETDRLDTAESVPPVMVLTAGHEGNYLATQAGDGEVVVRPIQGSQLFTFLMPELAGFVPGPYQRNLRDRATSTA
ncbi:hypothetical protein [Citricoccus sp. GCM10030269]|uniref:hypothetical protein n=1 Tax=Citricoccus sp. GCM10030269 TaxID=3273388 RepID=UPI00360DA82C